MHYKIPHQEGYQYGLLEAGSFEENKLTNQGSVDGAQVVVT